MNLICCYYAKWLIPYATGALERSLPAMDSRVARHLELCSACRSEAERLIAADRSLRRHVRSNRTAAAVDWTEGFRSTSATVSRVRSLIEPETRTASPIRWSPGVASFAGIATLAVFMAALIYPQSYARMWFASELLGRKPSASIVRTPAPTPLPAAVDPFRAPLAVGLQSPNEPVAPQPALPAHLPEVSIVRYRQAPAAAPSQPVDVGSGSMKGASSNARTGNMATSGSSRAPSPSLAVSGARGAPAAIGPALQSVGADTAQPSSPPGPPLDLMGEQPGLTQPGETAPVSAVLPVRPADQAAPDADPGQAKQGLPATPPAKDAPAAPGAKPKTQP
jgi:hypothetical protein